MIRQHIQSSQIKTKMHLKNWILIAAFITIAYAAAIEPLDLTAIEESQDVMQPSQNIREKRFILSKKALLIGGAVGLGLGLAKGAYLAHHHPVYTYPVYSYPVYHSYGYGGNVGWPGSYAYASAGASYW